MVIPNITLVDFRVLGASVWVKPEGHFVQVGATFVVPSVADGTPISVNTARNYPIELLSDTQALVLAVKEVALDAFRHELDEKLQLDGIVINPPHVGK